MQLVGSRSYKKKMELFGMPNQKIEEVYKLLALTLISPFFSSAGLHPSIKYGVHSKSTSHHPWNPLSNGAPPDALQLSSHREEAIH